MSSIDSLEGVNFSIENIHIERKRLEEKRKKLLVEYLQLQKEEADLQRICPHGNMLYDTEGWADPISHCPDCGLVF